MSITNARVVMGTMMALAMSVGPSLDTPNSWGRERPGSRTPKRKRKSSKKRNKYKCM